jgi:hypothetical protein
VYVPSSYAVPLVLGAPGDRLVNDVAVGLDTGCDDASLAVFSPLHPASGISTAKQAAAPAAARVRT